MQRKNSLSRPAFVKNAGLLTAGWPVLSSLPAIATEQYINNDIGTAALQWLGGIAPTISAGSTWRTLAQRSCKERGRIYTVC